MNYGILTRLLAIILWILSAAMLVSLGVEAFFGEAGAIAGHAFSFLITATFASFLYLVAGRRPQRIFRKEALAVVGLGWILASLFATLPYLFILEGVDFFDALFEAVSGLTTTGASVFGNLESWPRGLLFWRSLTQWMGGLGVVVFFVALLGSLGASARFLFAREAPSEAKDLEVERIQSGALRILYLYLGLTFACVVAYTALGMSVFDAVNHAFTTLSSGGFSTRSASFAAFDSAALEAVAIVFMLLATVNFLVLLRVLGPQRKRVLENTEVPVFLALVFGGVVSVFLLHLLNDAHVGWWTPLRQSAFNVVSIATTTGYATADFADVSRWTPGVQTVLLILMLIGGCSGSTAGGLKVARLIIGLRTALAHIERSFRSHVIRPLRINNRPVDPEVQDTVTSYIVLLFFIWIISWLAMAFLEPDLSFRGGISAATSCLFNIGPGFAEIGPTELYDFMQPLTKVYLSVLMIMGRLELFAILVLFTPSLWRRFR
jgi:trk system potassium uptake protein TrkH